MLESERPKGFVPGFGPFAHLMEQHGARPISHGLDSTLGDAVLKVSTDSAEIQFLFLELNVSLELG